MTGYQAKRRFRAELIASSGAALGLVAGWELYVSVRDVPQAANPLVAFYVLPTVGLVGALVAFILRRRVLVAGTAVTMSAIAVAAWLLLTATSNG